MCLTSQLHVTNIRYTGVLQVTQTKFSCAPDKDIRLFHLCLQILSHPCYLTQGRIKITCI